MASFHLLLATTLAGNSERGTGATSVRGLSGAATTFPFLGGVLGASCCAHAPRSQTWLVQCVSMREFDKHALT